MFISIAIAAAVLKACDSIIKMVDKLDSREPEK